VYNARQCGGFNTKDTKVKARTQRKQKVFFLRDLVLVFVAFVLKMSTGAYPWMRKLIRR
jgi:hypothetical protein